MCSRSLAVKLSSVLVRAWLVVVVAAGPAGAAEPESCRVVRFSDVGWTDITVTTALTSTILEALGYRPHTDMLAMLVTYESLKNRQIDVFLGAWEPSGGAQRAPYLADGSVDVAGKNLSGARFTLAVPSYVSAAGVRDFADLARFADRFQHRIYGIEPGNDGNRLIAQLIREGHVGLEGWTLVESSEQGMLSEVDRAVRKKDWIVFLGWSPHPMNLRYDMTYLAGGDDTFGPNYGGASVYTDVRHGYLTECPNVARLLRNLHFDTGMESEMMSAILVDKRDARTATRLWLESHLNVVSGWLDGVTTFDGKSGTDALRRALAPTDSAAGSSLERANQWLLHHKIPVGDWLSRSVQLITEHARGPLDGFSVGMGGMIAVITAALLRIPALVLLPVLVMFSYLVLRSIAFALFVGLSLLLIVNLGYWVATIETLSLVLCATGLSTLIGVPIGIVGAHRPWLYRLIQPILDLMQTIPTFVYLIPALVLFGLGTVPGLIATVVFAIPAPIRLTHLGISSVPKPLREAGLAFGATPLQLLVKVELPYASPTIMAGVTQCIMLSLSMVVIAALVGADGLGKPVVRALNSVNIAMGFEAGIAIVVLAIILDRLCKGRRSSSPVT